MNDTYALIEIEARQQIRERVSRAASPGCPRDPAAAPVRRRAPAPGGRPRSTAER